MSALFFHKLIKIDNYDNINSIADYIINNLRENKIIFDNHFLLQTKLHTLHANFNSCVLLFETSARFLGSVKMSSLIPECFVILFSTEALGVDSFTLFVFVDFTVSEVEVLDGELTTSMLIKFS